jgi:glycine betaine/proline transport system substrate-binding protein
MTMYWRKLVLVGSGHRGRGALALVATLTVAVSTMAGCATEVRAKVAPPGVEPAKCGTVTIAVNPWVGYEANVAVVSYLAKKQLRCTVVEKNLTEDQSWKGLANGEIDAILENWGHDEFKKTYIDQKKVAVEHGLTGNKGIIGWFVPPWLAKAHPDITDWRQLNKYAGMFQTAKSGGKGQILDGDPSYVTNDEALVRNLRLDYKVVYAGSEAALIDAFKNAEEQKRPLIGYFYSPQWLLSDIELVHIKLPAYTPGCDADPKTVACDYQPYDLDKIVRKKFADSGSPAATLIKNFQWTDADQNAVAHDIAERKLSRDDAAKRWLDANPSKWQRWLGTG